MSTAAAGGGGEDGNGGGDPKGKNTNTAPNPKKMTTFQRGMLHYLQGKTADAIARGEDPPYGGLYAPGGLYGPAANPSVPNPPTKKVIKRETFVITSQRWLNIETLYEVVVFDHAVL
jgi:hypothetical protein